MFQSARKTASRRGVTGSVGTVALTLVAVGALGLAVARATHGSAIFAAEPHDTPVLDGTITDRQLQFAAQEADGVSDPASPTTPNWAPAFGQAIEIVAPEPEEMPDEDLVMEDPPAPVEVVVETPSQRHLDYWLTGHILDGARSLAFVHDGGDEQVVRLGSVLSGGETVIEITEQGVRAEIGNEIFLIVARDDDRPGASQPDRSRADETWREDRAELYRPTGMAPPSAQPTRRSFLQQARSQNSRGTDAGRMTDLDNDDWGDDDDDDDWDDDDWDDDDEQD